MRNKAKRFIYKNDGTPGPTAYDPKIRTKKCPKLDPTPIAGKGKLYMCRVPYSAGPEGPSVPTHIDENGYDITMEDQLIKVPPNYHDRSLGPAFYDVPPVKRCLILNNIVIATDPVFRQIFNLSSAKFM